MITVSSCGIKLQEVLLGLEKMAKTLGLHMHSCGFIQHYYITNFFLSTCTVFSLGVLPFFLNDYRWYIVHIEKLVPKIWGCFSTSKHPLVYGFDFGVQLGFNIIFLQHQACLYKGWDLKIKINNKKIINVIHYIVSSADTNFFAHTLRPCRKIGSGHIHW